MTNFKVFLQYDSFWHYRKSLFKVLSEKCNLFIACGRKSVYSNLNTFSPDFILNYSYVKNIILFPKSHFVWQKGIILKFLKEKPDLIVLKGVDPHIISNFFLLLAAKIMKKKVVFWGHGTMGNQGEIGKLLRGFFYKLSDGVLVYSSMGKRSVSEFVNENKIFVLGNCVNFSDYKSEYSISPQVYNNYNILFTGRLHSRKKIDLAIQAVSILLPKYPDISFHIVGNGEEYQNLENLISSMRLQNHIKLYGAMYGEELHSIMDSASLYLLPSAAGLSVYHAFSYGLPVITDNDIDNHGPEFEDVLDGVNGLIYEKGNAEALARSIDYAFTKQFDRAGIRSFFLNNFTPDSVGSKFIAALEKVMDS